MSLFFEHIAEKRIQEAMDSGVFDNLPDKGRPLQLDDTPLELRILRNANVLPEWIQLVRDIEAGRAACRRLWAQTEREYRSRRDAVASETTVSIPSAASAFHDWLSRTRQEYLYLLRQVNNDIFKRVHLGPQTAGVQEPYRVEQEMARFDAEFPPLS